MKISALVLMLCTLATLPQASTAQVILTSNPLLQRTAAAGERYEGKIELTNSSKVPQEAKLYQTDYSSTADGRTGYGPPGSSPRSNAAWVSLSASRVMIPAGGKATVTYVVTVPTVTSLAGTYWSMLMVEAIDRADEGAGLSRDASGPGMAIRSKIRYGVQVATHVGAASPIRIAFDSVKASTEANSERILSFDFVNAATRAAQLLMTVELFSADGKPVRKLEQQRGLLYPGHSARQRFVFGKLPAGTYTAIVTADAGGDEMFGAQYTLRF